MFIRGRFDRREKMMPEDRPSEAERSPATPIFPSPTFKISFPVSLSASICNSDCVSNTFVQSAISKAMELLYEYTIFGAAHDSSARDLLPRCYPGTRIKIPERILSWFHDAEKRELLLWIHGHAGVGKSAIVQAIAQYLSSSYHLGSSVFISRQNGRNNSRYLFNTIAHQLATRIESYRNFVIEKLALDPDSVTKGLEEQFRTFIVEPFVEKKIDLCGEVWGILLDGLDELDELDEQHAQPEVIRLIASFILEHPHVPLVWVISSRPEPLISSTFKEEWLSSSYREVNIPAYSPDTCEDV